MAGNSVDYIIRLVADDSELKKKLSAGELLSKSEMAKIKQLLQATINSADKEAKNLGKDLQHGLNVDTTKLEDTLKFISGIFEELEKTGNPISDWAKTGKGVYKAFDNMQNSVAVLAQNVNTLQGGLNTLTSSFEDFKKSYQSFKPVDFANVAKDADKVAEAVGKLESTTAFNVVDGNVEKRLKGLKQVLTSLTKSEFKLDISDDDLDAKFDEISDIVYQKSEEIERYQKRLSSASLDEKQRASVSRAMSKANRELAQSYVKLMAIDERRVQLGKASMIAPTGDKEEYAATIKDWEAQISAVTSRVQKSIEKLETDINNTLGKSFAKAISEQISDIKLSLSLPDEQSFVNEINQYIARINNKDLDAIKIAIDDSANVIEKKSKRAYGDNPASDNAELDKLGEQTDKSFIQLTKTIGKKQKGILKNTQKWREDMIKAMKIAAKDLEFEFGWDKKFESGADSLFNAIQEYFERPENALKLYFDTDGIAKDLQKILGSEGLNLSLGGAGTATVDANAIASAVASAMHSVFFGGTLPNITPAQIDNNIDTTEVLEQVEEETDDATQSSREYVKALDETTLHIDKVIESLRSFAQVATKKNASKGAKNIAEWMSSQGIDISAIASGADDAKIVAMLQSALMEKDEFGQARGRTFGSELSGMMSSLKINSSKGAGKAISALRMDINELFDINEIATELSEQVEKRRQSLGIFKGVEQAGRSLALLGTVRSTKKKIKTPSVEDIDKVIANFEANGLDVVALNKLKDARIKLGDNSTDEAQNEFKVAAQEFYNETTSIFRTLSQKWGDFRGSVSVEGRKPITIDSRGAYPYAVLKIPENAVITNVETFEAFKVVDNGGVGSSQRRESSARKAEQQQLQMNRGSSGLGLFTQKPHRALDVVNKEIEYKPFKPMEKESSPIGTDMDLMKKQVAEIPDIINQINEGRALVEELTETRNLLQADIDNMSVEGHSDLKTNSFNKYSKLERNIGAVVTRAKNAIKTNSVLDINDISITDQETSDLVHRLQNNVRNLHDKTTESQQLTESIQTYMSANQMTRDDLEYNRRLAAWAGDSNATAFYTNLLFDNTYYDKVIANLEVQKANADKSMSLYSKNVPVLIKQLEDKKVLASGNASQEAEVLVRSLHELRQKLYDEAATYVKVLNDPDADDNTKAIATGKVQQALRGLKSARTTFASIQPYTTESFFANSKQESNFDKWIEAYTQDGINKAKQELSRLQQKLAQETDATIVAELKKQITNTKRYITRKEKVVPKDVTFDTKGKLSNVEKQIQEEEAKIRQNEAKLQAANQVKSVVDATEKDTTFLQRYNELLEREKALLEEINALKKEGADKDAVSQKERELSTTRRELETFLSDNQDIKRTEYARKAAIEYETQLRTAYSQRSVLTKEIERITKEQEDLEKYGFGAGVGARALSRTKRDITSEFMNSDYARAAEEALRNKVKAAINEATNKSQKIFDQKVANAMEYMGWDPLNQEQTKKFLNTKRGQQLSADFASEVDANEKNIWAQYNVYIEELQATLLKHFKDSFNFEDGILKATFKTQDESGNWVDAVRSFDVKDFVLKRLQSEKDIAESNRKPLDVIIADLKEQKSMAMRYGGVTDADLSEDKYLKQNATFIQDREKALDRLIQKEKELDNIQNDEEIDDKYRNKLIKEKQKEIDLINQQIDRYDTLINNRLKLIELHKQEKEESKQTPEEKTLLATERLTRANEDLAKTEQNITNLQTEYDNSKGTENEMKALKALNDEIEKKGKLQQKIVDTRQYIQKWSNRIAPETTEDDTDTNVVSVSGTGHLPSGGIVGAIVSSIKEALGDVGNVSGTIDVDGSDIATETTLSAILNLLGGGEPEIVDEPNVQDEIGLSRNKKNKNVAETPATVDVTPITDDPKSIYKSWNIKPQDLDFDTVKTKAVALKQVLDTLYDEGKTDTEEFINAQTELSKLLSAWRNKIGKTTNPELYGKDTGKENWVSYLTSGDTKIFDNLNNVELSSISQKDYLSRLKKIGVEPSKTKEPETTLQIKDFDDFKLQVQALKKVIEAQPAGSEDQKKLQALFVQVLQTWAKNEQSGLEKSPTSKEWAEYLVNRGVFDNIDTAITPLTNRQLNKSGKVKSDTQTTPVSKPATKSQPAQKQPARAETPAERPNNTAQQRGILGAINNLAKESTLGKVLTALGEIAKKNAASQAGKANSAQDLLEQFRRMLESDAWEGRERVAYVDLATGAMSNSITGDDKSISAERLNILRSAYQNVMDLNAQVHTHADVDDPYFSADDLSQFINDFNNGITKQILLSKNNMTVLDMTDVKDINGLLNALSKTEHNFEALAATAEKFGAKYANRAFNEITPQGLVKMLGIKGIESKYTETETRDNAIKGVLEEDAKEAAEMLQESTGRAIKKTVERVGAELMTTTEKTDAKGNKTWSKQINDKYTKAALATNKAFNDLKLTDAFGIGTDAQLALVEYKSIFEDFLYLTNEFKKDPNQDGLQELFNNLLPKLDAAEEKLRKIIAQKDKFLGGKEAIKIFEGADLANAGDSLKQLAISRYASELNRGGIAGDNIAFNGISETPNGTRLLVDILKDGTIQQYALEVDKATGQVKEFMVAEHALANAFQNVNKAMRQNEIVKANVAIGDDPAQQQQFMNHANSSEWNAYKKALYDMEVYVANIWNRMANGGSNASKEELDYIMALSENVLALGKNVQKTSIDFKNFWAQNPENVTAFSVDYDGTVQDRNEKVRSSLEKYAQTYASANQSQYSFTSFDGDALNFKLTDIEGNIRNVTLVWNELYQQIANVSDKSVVALDPLVAKMQQYQDVSAQAIREGYLSADDASLTNFKNKVAEIDDIVQGIKNGTLAYAEQKDKLEQLRQSAINYGDIVNKTIGKNKRLYVGTNEINSVNRQRDKIVGAFGADNFESSDIVLVQQYEAAYQRLNNTYTEFANNRTLYDAKNQEQLRQQAIGVQNLGKKLIASITQADKLHQLVEQSGSYTDSKGIERELGGVSEPLSEQAAEAQNLEATMRSYVENALGQTNIENAKFNKTTQQLTYTIRISKDAVADMVVQYNNAENALFAYNKQERESLTGLAAFYKGFKSKIASIMQYVASITSIYRVFGELKRGIQYVREIDSALTELKKVTDETEESYDRFLETAAKTADKVGSTITNIVSSTADWARLGFSMEDAARLAESTSVLLNVSEFSSIEDATSALTSTMQAFGYVAEDSMYVVDVLNEVGNNFSISSDGIATALQDSASALMAANNSYEEAVALIAAANRVVQDPNSVGAALRTISLRLRGTSVKELEEAGEDTTGAITSKSKLRGKIKTLSGVDILTDTGAYKSTYEILLEISRVWEDMSDIDQAALLEILAGKNRANTAMAILSNTTDLEEAYVSALKAEGSAYAENEKYLDSIQGKIDLFNNAVQAMWSNTLNDEWIKGFVELGTLLIKLVDDLGLINVLLTGLGAVGFNKLHNFFDFSSIDFKHPIKSFKELFGRQQATNIETITENLEKFKKAADEAAAKVTSSKNPSKKDLKQSQQAQSQYDTYYNAAQPYIEADKTTKKLTEELDDLEKQLVEAQDEMNTAFEAMNNGVDGASQTYDNAKQKVENLTYSISDHKRQLADTTKTLQGVGDVQDDLGKKGTGVWAKLGKSVGKFAAAIAESVAAMLVMYVIFETISMVSNFFDSQNETAEEAQTAFEELNNELSNCETELTTLNSQLEDTKKQIDDLMSQGTLSFSDQEELDRLKETSAELERQIALKETLGVNLQKGTNAKSINATNKYLNTSFSNEKTKTENQEETSKIGKLIGTIVGLVAGGAAILSAIPTGGLSLLAGAGIGGVIGMAGGSAIGSAIGGASYDKEQTVGDAIANMREAREELIKARDEAFEAYTKNPQDEDIATKYQEAEQALTQYDETMAKHISQIQANYNAMDWEHADPTQREAMIEQADLLDKYNIEMGNENAKSNAITRIFGEEADTKLKDIKQKIEAAVETGEDFDFLRAFNSYQFKDVKQRLDELGLSITDVKYYFLELVEAEQEAEENFSVYDTVSSIASLSDGVSDLKDAYVEFDEQGLVTAKTLIDLEEQFGSLGDAWTNYINVVSSGTSSMEDAKEATIALMEAFVNQKLANGPITDLREYMTLITQLRSMGVMNAEEYVAAKQKGAMVSAIAKSTVNAMNAEGNTATEDELASKYTEDYQKQYDIILDGDQDRLLLEKAITAEKAKQAEIEAQTKENERNEAIRKKDEADEKLDAAERKLKRAERGEKRKVSEVGSKYSRDGIELWQYQGEYYVNGDKQVDYVDPKVVKEAKKEVEEAEKEVGSIDIPAEVNTEDAKKEAERAEKEYQEALDGAGLKLDVQLNDYSADLDKIQSAYDALSNAVEEYNKKGFLSLDNLQALLSLEPEYLACLQMENGQLLINQQALEAMVKAKLADAKATVVQDAMTQLNTLATRKEEDAINDSSNAAMNAIGNLGTYAGALSGVSQEAIVAAGAVAAFNAAVAGAEANELVDQAEIDAVLSNMDTKLKIIDSVSTNLASNFDAIVSPDTSSDKDKEDALEKLRKEYENKIALLEAQQTYLENEIARMEAEDEQVTKDIYEEQIRLEEQKLSLYEQERAALLEAMNSVEKGSDEWYEYANAVWETEHAIQESTLAIIEFEQSIVDLYVTAFDKIEEAYGHLENLRNFQVDDIQVDIEYAELTDKPISADYYKRIIEVQTKDYNEKLAEAQDLRNTRELAVANSKMEVGDEEWVDLTERIYEAEAGAKQLRNEIAETNEDMKQLYVTAFDKVKEAYDALGNLYSDRQSYTEGWMELQELRGEPTSVAAYEYLMSNTEAAIADKTQEIADLEAKLSNAMANGVKEGSEEWIQMTEDIRASEKELQDLNIDLEQTNQNLKDLYYTAFEKIRDSFGNITDVYNDQEAFIESYIDYLETMGVSVPEEVYDRLSGVIADRQQTNYENLAKLQQQLAEMEAKGYTPEDEEWVTAHAELRKLEKQLWDDEVAQAEINKRIQELDTEKFEEYAKRVQDVVDELENLYDLLADEDVANEDGSWTEEGITSLGLLYQKMEIAKKQMADYQEEIEKLNDEYKSGAISEQDYNDRLVELKNSQWDAIDAYESAKDAIVDINEARVDMIEEGIQEEIDAYQELIDLKKEELDAERDLYEFRKNINNQTKDIAALERKIAAMSGSTDAATIAERTKLEAQLREAQEALDDTYYSHAMDSQSTALDDENEAYVTSKEDYIELLREALEDVEAIVANTMSQVLINADTVLGTLNDVSGEYGVTLSDSLITPWIDAAKQAEAFKNSALMQEYEFAIENGIFTAELSSDFENLFINTSDFANQFNENVTITMEAIRFMVEEKTSDMQGNMVMPFSTALTYAQETFSPEAIAELEAVAQKARDLVIDETNSLKGPWESGTEAVNTYGDTAKRVLEEVKKAAQDYDPSDPITDPIDGKGGAIDTYELFGTTVEGIFEDLVTTATDNAKKIATQMSNVVSDAQRAADAINNTSGSGSNGDSKNNATTTQEPTTPTKRTPKSYKVIAQVQANGRGFKVTARGSTTKEAEANVMKAMYQKLKIYHQQKGRSNDWIDSMWEKTWSKKVTTGTFTPEYAKGTLGTKKDQWAITDEPQYGDELVLIPGKGGNLQYMRKGTAVIPADISANLMEWGKINPNMDMSGAIQGVNLMTNVVNKPELNLSFDALVKAEHITEETLPAVKKLVTEELEKFSRKLNYNLKRVGG